MADIDVTYEPISVVSGPVTVQVTGLDNTANKITLETPQPVRLETKSDVAVTQPIRFETKSDIAVTQPIKTESRFEADSKTAVDIKPLAIDQCLRISLAPLPPTCIRVPIQQQIGFTIFGVEIVGFRLSGEAQIQISDPAQEPHVVWGEETPAAPDRRPAGGMSRSLSTAGEQPPGDRFRITLGGERR